MTDQSTYGTWVGAHRPQTRYAFQLGDGDVLSFGAAGGLQYAVEWPGHRLAVATKAARLVALDTQRRRAAEAQEAEVQRLRAAAAASAGRRGSGAAAPRAAARGDEEHGGDGDGDGNGDGDGRAGAAPQIPAGLVQRVNGPLAAPRGDRARGDYGGGGDGMGIGIDDGGGGGGAGGGSGGIEPPAGVVRLGLVGAWLRDRQDFITSAPYMAKTTKKARKRAKAAWNKAYVKAAQLRRDAQVRQQEYGRQVAAIAPANAGSTAAKLAAKAAAIDAVYEGEAPRGRRRATKARWSAP